MQIIHTVDASQAHQSFPAVRVGDITIAEDRIAAELQYHAAEQLEEAWHEAARSLVIRELLLQEADRISLAAYPTEEERIAMLIDQALDVPTPDEDSCRRFFEANPDRFKSPTLLAVSHILLAAAPDDLERRPQQLELAETLITRLQARPSDFAAFASAHSACESRMHGGQLGQLSRGQTVDEFERVVWRLPEGLHLQAIESRYGWHIVRVDRRMDGVPLGFDQARPSIHKFLLESVTRRALRQYVQALALDYGVEGVDLELPDSPLMQ